MARVGVSITPALMGLCCPFSFLNVGVIIEIVSTVVITLMAESEQLVGHVTHYYSKIGVAIVELSEDVSAGDMLHYKGKTTDFEAALSSIPIEHEDVSSSKYGKTRG